ncbi:ABC transporter permease [Georgenia thermotolerans]|uniref:FtsX-like permease family protein n=1 Tax=Georgenia thermotolerans TaxID=527326 RepID=A0A7J5UKF3_9MICO|nr:ABC transporter permease [Georgenia thermotolerans]KAE8762816.1 FtsX-like permease family protein [Georgenia thermotolerans]
MTTVRLLWLLTRRGSAARGTVALPVAAFAATTTLLLTVLAGAVSFLRWHDEMATFYQSLAALAVILLVLPLLTLGGSAARLSARRRDDRLATLRLLGATPATVAAMTVAESAVLALGGAVAGVLGYLLLGPAVQQIPFRGEAIGAAYWLPPLAVLAAVATVTVLGAVSAAVGLRRVVISPLGVRTRQSADRVRGRRAVVAAIVVVAAVVALQSSFREVAVAVAVILGAFAAGLGVLNLVGPWAVGVVARSQLRRARTAERLIAARQVLDAPKAAWRQVGGVAMTSFVAVFAGTGMAMMAGQEPTSGPEMYLAQDIRTGILITLVASFLTVACSVGVNQAASVLDRADLYVSLDRLGMPRKTLEAARTRAVMVPLLTVALGSAGVAAALVLPLVGLALVMAPLSVAVLLACLAAGVGLVRLALLGTRPVVGAVLAPGGAART